MRCGREHCGSQVAVGRGRRHHKEDEEDEEDDEEAGGRRQEQEEEQATDIKSNNPHLAGGEKWGSDHFWTFRCRFARQAQGIAHVVKSEKNVRPKTMAGVGHLKRICKDAFSVAGAVQETEVRALIS